MWIFQHHFFQQYLFFHLFEIDKKNITLNAPINKLGEYKMLIKLTSKVKTELAVNVTASEIVKETLEVEETPAAEGEAPAAE